MCRSTSFSVTLVKTEGTINIGQSRDTSNSGHKTQKTKKMSITVATTNKTVGEPMCSSKGKQFLFPIRRPPCYSCSSPVEVVSLIEERKHQHKRDDIYCLFNTVYF